MVIQNSIFQTGNTYYTRFAFMLTVIIGVLVPQYLLAMPISRSPEDSNSPVSAPTPFATAQPSPTPLSPNSCPVYEVQYQPYNIHWTYLGNSWAAVHQEDPSRPIFYGNVPSCTAKILEKCKAPLGQAPNGIASAAMSYQYYGQSGVSGMWGAVSTNILYNRWWNYTPNYGLWSGLEDNCVAWYLKTGEIQTSVQPVILYQQLLLTTFMGVVVPYSTSYVGQFISGVSYLDTNCNRVESPTATTDIADSCKFNSAYMADAVLDIRSTRSSPISLFWNGAQESIIEEPVFVKFAVDPNKEGKWFLWHASANLPLLVHDPMHTGNITSATQLFGNHTFGKSWANGYEALKSLDDNTDGELSGTELVDFGLWFDRNRNGVSEEGEVLPLLETGVSRLFFEFDRTDPVTGDILALRGYEIEKNGIPSVHPSVDWFSVSFTNPPTPNIKENEFRNDGTNLSGAWFWRLDKPESVLSQLENRQSITDGGVLTFIDSQGIISGHSIVEHKVRSTVSTGTVVQFSPLEGTKYSTKQGTVGLRFSLEMNKVDIETEASLSTDGNYLRGTSEERRDGVVLRKYTWTAVRARS